MGVRMYFYKYLWQTGYRWSVVYPLEMHLILISHKILSAQNIFLSCLIILTFLPEHDNIIAVLCAKCQKHSITKMEVMELYHFLLFEFVMSFGVISCIATAPDICLANNKLYQYMKRMKLLHRDAKVQASTFHKHSCMTCHIWTVSMQDGNCHITCQSKKVIP